MKKNLKRYIYNVCEQVKTWITFHDPQKVAYEGYETGTMPPGIRKQDGTSVYVVAHNLLKAHAVVYNMYQETFKEKQKGTDKYCYSQFTDSCDCRISS